MEVLKPRSLPLKSKSFNKSLQTIARDVEKTLDILLPPPTTRLHEAMRYSVLGGGKRFRSYLVWASAQLFEVPSSHILKTAAALELFHAYSLVHDDLPCMDNADIRRGKPSCHKAYGEATATLVGDALIPLAFQTLSSLKISPNLKIELIEKTAHTIGSDGLVAGQMMDLGQEGPRSTLKDLLEQQRLKTGVLFGIATEAGAILGSASKNEKEILKHYGLKLGQAFQMMDDWLDGCGQEKKMGKPCHQDAAKFTFLTLLGPALLHKEINLTLQEATKIISPLSGQTLFLEEAALYILNQFK